jgi:ATP-dependent exoDNAse (exonuclease V) alpha subunit
VVPLGRAGGESRFTTLDLLACERTIIDVATRNPDRQIGLLAVESSDPALEAADRQLTGEQLTAVRAIATDGRGLSVLQALAGTGKTRVLAALANAYLGAGHRVIGVAPTGRAARELSDAAGIPALTIHKLVSDLEESGGFAPRTVLLFDEAGTDPTRPSSALLAHADAGNAKVIIAGDTGQLPPVAAGGWFAAVAQMLDGPELRDVMRQRDPAERDALDALHDGDPGPYLELKHEQGALTVHEREREAVARTLAAWDAARRTHGPEQAVMISRDNATRALLNRSARQLLIRDGTLGQQVFRAGDRDFRIGDRVIARRNDRYHAIDNGTIGRITVAVADAGTGAITITTDTGKGRTLDADYVAAHLDHAYALTAHGALGATFDWAGVVGRGSEFTREWAYTALTRARVHTRLDLISEATAGQRERDEYAPPSPNQTATEGLRIMNRSMIRREAEPLAVERAAPAPQRSFTEPAGPSARLPTEPDWRRTSDRGAPLRGLER